MLMMMNQWKSPQVSNYGDVESGNEEAEGDDNDVTIEGGSGSG